MENEDGHVDTVVSLTIPDAVRRAAFYRIPEHETARMGRIARGHGLVALAQIHTHPTGYGVIHSPYDDEHALSLGDGFLSLVFPDYGGEERPLEQIGVHERFAGRWVLLDAHTTSRRVVFVREGS